MSDEFREYRKRRYSAFTAKAKRVARDVRSEVTIRAAAITGLPSDAIKTQAIWDTGATNSVISPSLRSRLNLIAFGKVPIFGVGQADQSGSGPTSDADVCVVDIALPNNVNIIGARVAVASIGGDPAIDLLLGMDIIAMGDFALTADSTGNTVFSFRFPHYPVAIDFVESINRYNESMVRATAEKERLIKDRAFQPNQNRKKRKHRR